MSPHQHTGSMLPVLTERGAIVYGHAGTPSIPQSYRLPKMPRSQWIMITRNDNYGYPFGYSAKHINSGDGTIPRYRKYLLIAAVHRLNRTVFGRPGSVIGVLLVI